MNNSQYPIEFANKLIGNKNPNTHYAVFIDYSGDEHIEELNAPTISQAEEIAMTIYTPDDMEFVSFIDEYVSDRIYTLNNTLQSLQAVVEVV